MAISSNTNFKLVLVNASALPTPKEEGAIYVWKNGLYLGTSINDVVMLGQVESVVSLESVTNPVPERFYVLTTDDTLHRWDGSAWHTIGGSDASLTAQNFSIVGRATAAAVSFDGTAAVALNVTSLDATGLSGAIPSNVTATTQAPADNTSKIATTAYADAAAQAVSTSLTANTYTKSEVDAKVASVYRVKGSVDQVTSDATHTGLDDPYANTENSGTYTAVEGDVWNVTATGDNYVWVAGDPTGSWDKLSASIDITDLVTLDTDQTITGTKTFSNTIVGNASTATALATSRSISITDANSVTTATAASFNGSADASISLTALNAALLTGEASVNTTGNAATATQFETGRTINIYGEGITSVAKEFNGTANVSIGPVAFTTQSQGDNSTKPATTQYVDTAVSAATIKWTVVD